MSEAAAGSTPNVGWKKGLPAYGLPTAEEAAQKLWHVARLATVTPEVFARQFGAKSKPSGGGWDTRIALLRGFKLIRFEDKNIGLSQLGQDLVNASNPDGQRTARRTALLNIKAYEDLVTTFNNTALPDDAVLGTRLQFEYGKKEDFALRAAKAFRASLVHAEMLGPGDIVLKEGIGAGGAPPVDPEMDDLDDDADLDIDADLDEDEAQEDDDQVDDDINRDHSDEAALTPRPNVNLDVTLDLSRFRAEEVIQIINALGLGGRA